MPSTAEGAQGAEACGHLAFQRSLGKSKAKRGKAKRAVPRRSILWGPLIHEQINGRQVPWHMGAATWLQSALGAFARGIARPVYR